MNYKVDLQCDSTHSSIPNLFQIQRWVSTILSSRMPSAEVCIRVVDFEESQQLNCDYRGKNKPTNVLSFPFTAPESITLDTPLLGDLIICAPLVAEEAQAQHKEEIAHWAHLVIHGILHLLGYDHIEEKEAEIMEPIEIELLAELGYANPYEAIDDHD